MKQLEYADIVVIASGPSGLAAAIAAAEKGASVAVLEKNSTGGGAANMGMGPLGIETSIQKNDLISIRKEEAFKKFMTYTHWRSNARLVREYLYKSGSTIEWLLDMGVEFEGAFKYFSQEGAEATWHVVKSDTGRHGGGGAATMIRIMTERATELGVQFYYETPGTEIIQNDAGEVVAVAGVDKNGEEVEIECAAAVICTGGFGSNAEMIKEHIGFTWGPELRSFRVPGCVGDGIKMAWKAGAAKTEMAIEQAGGTMLDGNYTCLAVTAEQPNLCVNIQGERIMNEAFLGNSTFRSNICSTQKGKHAYSIFDQSIIDLYMKQGFDVINMVGRQLFPTGFEADVASAVETKDPGFAVADSIEELAEKVGFDPVQLRKTIEEYNAMCETHDSLYFKDQKFMHPIVGPKYYCVTMVAGGYGTLGGIKINDKAEVIDPDFAPIPGLYAAGTDTCTIYADSYVFILPGNTMGYALNSGRIAGEHAVQYVTDLYARLDAEEAAAE